MSRAFIVAVLIALAVVATGCAEAAPTQTPEASAPSGPATPAATASPSVPAEPAVDVAAAFLEVVTTSTFAATVAIKGEAVVGRSVSSQAGTLLVAGTRSRLDVTSTAGTKETRTQSIVVDGTRYAPSRGVWFATGDPRPADLGALFAGISSGVTDVGPETREGRDLHHLAIVPPSSFAAAMGVDRDTFTSVTTSLDAWVEEDGTPVEAVLAAAWTQPVDGGTAAATKRLTFQFTDVGTPPRIEPPGQVWQWSGETRYGYRMAHPVGWAYQQGTTTTADAYYGYEGEAVYATRGRNQGLSLRTLSSGLSRYLPQITGIRSPKVTSNTGARLGPLPARRVEYTFSKDGARYHSVLYLAVKGSYYYVVELETTARTTDAHRDLAADFARTFSTR